VLAADHWHPGVLGIVAARAAEATGKPVLLIAFQGDVGRGSGRCNNGVHLRDALGDCADLLVAHGGHAAAAGVELRREHLDAFRERFADACARRSPDEQPLEVDGLASFAELDPQSVRRLEMLGPFGNGHPRPRFVTHGVRLVGNPFVDQRGSDVRVRIVDDGQLLPARVVRGLVHFETMRRHRGAWSIAYTPRLSPRGEEGPVLLEVHDLSAGDEDSSHR
jgi:single-stranded-DNA-specific exonuclease